MLAPFDKPHTVSF